MTFSLDAPYFLPWSWSGADWLQYYCLGDGVEQTGSSITALEMECSIQAPVFWPVPGADRDGLRELRAAHCSPPVGTLHTLTCRLANIAETS